MINRRTFLKSLTAACGAAVVCPGELLKSPVAGIDPSKPVWWTAIDCSDKKFRKAFEKHKFRPPFYNVIQKARQQGCTNSILYGIPYWIECINETYQT